MLNKLNAFIRTHGLLRPGDAVVCAVSGGADSMALLWAMYLMREQLDIRLSAAHFNHRLRGAESDRDEAFVREFCEGYQIPFISGSGDVTAGEKGLEAAAREARYAFLCSLPGKIATAHTADDNAETVLMHLVRGTGLKGLCGIRPVNGSLIRPMLEITREEVLSFLDEYCISYVEDSSNGGDDFLRNRLRHNVMPLLKRENPSLSPNISAMALRLRQDEAALDVAAQTNMTRKVSRLRELEPGVRSRILAQLLLEAGVREPESAQILALEKLVFSDKPSARANFAGGITVERNYDELEMNPIRESLETIQLKIPGETVIPQANVRILCEYGSGEVNNPNAFYVIPVGVPVVRARLSGDTIRLCGGTKSLKKLFVDEKIPASRRKLVPVIADEAGVLGVAGIGGNLDRLVCGVDALKIRIEYL